MNTDDEITEVIADMSVIYQQDKATIDTQITTAKAYPRNIRRSVDNAIAIVTMDKESAAECTYSVPRGGKQITGPSVHLARAIVQCWGNFRSEVKVIEEGKKHVISQAIAWDLENNVATKVEVKRSIMTRNGRMTDDMITVTGNAANAIAYRNAVFAVVPKSVTAKVLGEANKFLIGDVSDEQKLKKEAEKVVNKLVKIYSVSIEEVLSAIGKTEVSQVTQDNILTLIGIGTAIKDGDTTVEFAFKGIKPDKAADVAEQKAEIKEQQAAQTDENGQGKIVLP